MKAKHIFITSGVILGGVWLAGEASALTYQDTETIEFTFSPSLELTLSGTNLNISDLAPGTSGASDPISVTVTTNNAVGYELSATVGTSVAPYNGTSLVHSSTSSSTANSAATNKFASIATDASTALTSIAEGYWGYVTDANTTYSGLPYGTTKLLKQKSSSATDGEVTQFKIGATASSGMLGGEYSNTIVFQAVTKVNSGS